MLKARDIMTQPVVVIRKTATVENAIWLIRAKRVRSLVVEEAFEKGPYGILTEKDIVYKVIAQGDNPRFVRVSSIMRQPCIQVPPHATLLEVAQILAEAGVHRAPVIEQDELLGIVSVTDILLKGYPGAAPPRDELSQRIQEALGNARIIDDQDAQIEQECDVAWQILEDMRLDAAHYA
ncbi:CBS domain-containing protein [Romeria aff. gracilis LEGE 07310]|uniref:CBS domain-containing protein n=1 Tax=Vasconcelosia minhoensis LEGE 07310 TaxID=915328 RepID=A0A8J7ASH4_9CYAN|nr:CBS domain-containing protein [Romeria gracilis]MBE9079906.1 CBS domain-containing protein [Romeria aff. gracilis LEGE 07310]